MSCDDVNTLGRWARSYLDSFEYLIPKKLALIVAKQGFFAKTKQKLKEKYFIYINNQVAYTYQEIKFDD